MAIPVTSGREVRMGLKPRIVVENAYKSGKALYLPHYSRRRQETYSLKRRIIQRTS